MAIGSGVGLWLVLEASAAPVQISQSGRLLGSSGEPATGLHAVTVRVWDAASGGNLRHEETFLLTIEDGYYSVVLGTNAANELDSDDLTGAAHVELAVDNASLGRTQLRPVPLATHLAEDATKDGHPVATMDDVTAATAGMATEAGQQQILDDLGGVADDLEALQTAVEGIATTCADEPEYSTTCSDWASKGWGSERRCLTDGRWHRYAHMTTNQLNNSSASITLQQFHIASQEGADTKMRIGREWYEVSVRYTDGHNAFYVFVKEKTKHISFTVYTNGTIDSFHMSTNDSGWHDNFRTTDLGNWHYMQHNYSHLGALNIGTNNGVEFWARY
jgi:hypothetical protein